MGEIEYDLEEMRTCPSAIIGYADGMMYHKLWGCGWIGKLRECLIVNHPGRLSFMCPNHPGDYIHETCNLEEWQREMKGKPSGWVLNLANYPINPILNMGNYWDE